jgi:hypothetical protein
MILSATKLLSIDLYAQTPADERKKSNPRQKLRENHWEDHTAGTRPGWNTPRTRQWFPSLASRRFYRGRPDLKSVNLSVSSIDASNRTSNQSAESLLPFDDGLRFDNDQDLPPILPEPGENHPEESIPPMQLGPVNFPVEDGQLLTQG